MKNILALFGVLSISLTGLASVKIRILDKNNRPVSGAYVYTLLNGKVTSIEGDDSGLPGINTQEEVLEGFNYVTGFEGEITSSVPGDFSGNYGGWLSRKKPQYLSYMVGVYSNSKGGAESTPSMETDSGYKVFQCQVTSGDGAKVTDIGNEVLVLWKEASDTEAVCKSKYLTANEILAIIKRQLELAQDNGMNVPIKGRR